jgi:hypothetical protein
MKLKKNTQIVKYMLKTNVYAIAPRPKHRASCVYYIFVHGPDFY